MTQPSTSSDRWLLPVGIEDILPAQAQQVEQLRRTLLDLYQSWGYQMVIPPFVDYLHTLLSGSGEGSDLDLQTFKLIDQISGRLLGVRADMTPQVARIDAHQLGHDGPSRLCYLGTVLRTRPNNFGGSRSPLQIGAELFGASGINSEVEILRLVMLTLEKAGITESYLDLGHVGIYRGLARQAELAPEIEHQLFEALQRKDLPSIEQLIGDANVHGHVADMLTALADLNGTDALSRAKHVLRHADTAVLDDIDYLQRLADELQRWLPDISIHYDLAELRNYHYKTGTVFAIFVPGWGLEVVRGGRYDNIGRTFGRARPAVGFSADLKDLIQRAPNQTPIEAHPIILAPWQPEPRLQQLVKQLREQGYQVVNELPDSSVQSLPDAHVHRIIQRTDQWVVEPPLSAVQRGTHNHG